MAMNGKITITKEKYEELRDKAKQFEFIQKLAFDADLFFKKPSTRNIADIIGEMKKTGRYNNDFLKSLRAGFKKSSYFGR